MGSLTAPPRSVPHRAVGPSLQALLQVQRTLPHSQLRPPSSTQAVQLGPRHVSPNAADSAAGEPAPKRHQAGSRAAHRASLPQEAQRQQGSAIPAQPARQEANAVQPAERRARGRNVRPVAQRKPQSDSPLDRPRSQPASMRQSNEKLITPRLSLSPTPKETSLSQLLAASTPGRRTESPSAGGSELSFAQKLSPASLVGSNVSAAQTGRTGTASQRQDINPSSHSPDAALQRQPEGDFQFPNPPDATAPLFGSQSLMPGMDCSYPVAAHEASDVQHPLSVQQSMSRQSCGAALSSQSLPASAQFPTVPHEMDHCAESVARQRSNGGQLAVVISRSSTPSSTQAVPGSAAAAYGLHSPGLLYALSRESAQDAAPDSAGSGYSAPYSGALPTPATSGAELGALNTPSSAEFAEGAALAQEDLTQILREQSSKSMQTVSPAEVLESKAAQPAASDANAPDLERVVSGTLQPQLTMRATAEALSSTSGASAVSAAPSDQHQGALSMAQYSSAGVLAQHEQQSQAKERSSVAIASTRSIPQRPLRSTSDVSRRPSAAKPSLIAMRSIPQKPMRSTAEEQAVLDPAATLSYNAHYTDSLASTVPTAPSVLTRATADVDDALDPAATISYNAHYTDSLASTIPAAPSVPNFASADAQAALGPAATRSGCAHHADTLASTLPAATAVPARTTVDEKAALHTAAALSYDAHYKDSVASEARAAQQGARQKREDQQSVLAPADSLSYDAHFSDQWSSEARAMPALPVRRIPQKPKRADEHLSVTKPSAQRAAAGNQDVASFGLAAANAAAAAGRIPCGSSIPRTPPATNARAAGAQAAEAPARNDQDIATAVAGTASCNKASEAASCPMQEPLAAEPQPAASASPQFVVPAPLQTASPAAVGPPSEPFARVADPFAPRQMLRRSDEAPPALQTSSLQGTSALPTLSHDKPSEQQEAGAVGRPAAQPDTSAVVDALTLPQPLAHLDADQQAPKASDESGAQAALFQAASAAATLANAAPSLPSAECSAHHAAPPRALPALSPQRPPRATAPAIMSPVLPYIHTKPYRPSFASQAGGAGRGGSPAPATPPSASRAVAAAAAPFAVSVRQAPGSPAFRVGCFPRRSTSLNASPSSPMVNIAYSPLASPRIMTHASMPVSPMAQNMQPGQPEPAVARGAASSSGPRGSSAHRRSASTLQPLPAFSADHEEAPASFGTLGSADGAKVRFQLRTPVQTALTSSAAPCHLGHHKRCFCLTVVLAPWSPSQTSTVCSCCGCRRVFQPCHLTTCMLAAMASPAPVILCSLARRMASKRSTIPLQAQKLAVPSPSPCPLLKRTTASVLKATTSATIHRQTSRHTCFVSQFKLPAAAVCWPPLQIMSQPLHTHLQFHMWLGHSALLCTALSCAQPQGAAKRHCTKVQLAHQVYQLR